MWQAQADAEQYEVKLQINETNKTIVNAFCDVRFPTRDVEEHHIATFVLSCVQHGAEYKDAPKDHVYEAFVVDFTTSAFNFPQRSAGTW